MRGLRSALSAAATAALIVGSVGSALAAGSSTAQYETRADFVYRLDLQLGIKPVFPVTPNFKDVPTSSPYYGYIEAAYQAGITNGFSNGTFGPGLPLTRAEAAKYEVIADGYGSAATAIASTIFADNAQIPTALVGYVAEANQLGLLKGFQNNTFQPMANLTVAQETHLLTQLQTVMAAQTPASLTITASATNVGPGQIVTLSASATNGSGSTVTTGTVTYKVTGSNVQDTLMSGSSFVASQSGVYTIQGTSGNATGTITINVYGTAAGLKVSAPASIVANGSAASTVTVTVVDAQGNVVGNSSASVTLTSNNTYAVGIVNGTLAGSSATATAVNGVASFTVQGGTVPGSTATLTATSGTFTGSAIVSTTVQTATTLAITASNPYLAANTAGTTATVDVQVLDQSGQPMLYGTYAFSVSLNGPAEFPGGTTAAQSYVYTGTGSRFAGTPVTIEDVQGSTGSILVTASGTGLTSGSATLTAVIAGLPSAIEVTPPTSPTFSEDSGGVGLTYGIAVVDSHGYPVNDNVPLVVTVKNSSGQIAQNIRVDTFSQSATAGATDPNAVANGRFTLTDTGIGADAGTYTVQVTDPASVLAPSAADSFTETAGAAAAIKLSAPQYVSAANPVATVTAQIVDAHGNGVGAAGTPITFSSTATSITPTSIAVPTNSNGQAVASFTVPGYVGSSYPVTATATLNGHPYSTNPVSFTVESTTATAVSVALADNTSGSQFYTSPAIAQSGDQVKVTVKATDQYNNPVQTSDTVVLSLAGGATLTSPNTASVYGGGIGKVVNNGNGTWTVTLFLGEAVFAATAGATGTVSVQATDTSVSPAVQGASVMSIVAGPAAGFGVYDSAGNLATSESVAANTPIPLTVRPADVSGNPAVASQNFLVGLNSSLGGQFRVGSPSGANLNPGQGVLVQAGSGGVTVYFVTGTALTGDDISAPYWVGFPSGVTVSSATGALMLQNGANIAFSTSGGGQITDYTTPGNVNSNVFTAPSTGSGTDILDLTVGGTTVLTFDVVW